MFSTEGSGFIDKIISGPKDDATLEKILCKKCPLIVTLTSINPEYEQFKIFNILRSSIVEINYGFK